MGWVGWRRWPPSPWRFSDRVFKSKVEGSCRSECEWSRGPTCRYRRRLKLLLPYFLSALFCLSLTLSLILQDPQEVPSLHLLPSLPSFLLSVGWPTPSPPITSSSSSHSVGPAWAMSVLSDVANCWVCALRNEEEERVGRAEN